MMTQSGFSSKFSRRIQKIGGSLALRVLFISALLIILPLLFHNFILYMQEYRLKMRDLFHHYEALGVSQAQRISENFSLRLDELEAIAALSDFSNPALNESFTQIAEEQELSTLFYLKRENEGATVCVNANQSSLIGKRDLFKEQIQKTIADGTSIFSAPNPITGKKELYLTRVVYAEKLPAGAIGLSINADHWIQTLEKEPDYALSLFKNQTLVASTSPTFSLEKVEILQDAEEKIGVFHRFAKKKERMGTLIPISGTPFFLLIDFPEKLAVELQHEEFFSRLTMLFVFLFLLGGIGVLWISYRLSRPLRSLARDFEKVGKGDLEAKYTKDKLGFEINDLGESFNQMTASLKHHIKETEKHRISRELLKQELQIGHEIQKNLFPKELPHFPGVEIATGFAPAKEVAGDFYDLFVLPSKSHELLLSIADGSGKGISACLYSLLVRSMLRSLYAASSDLPSLIQDTNQLFCEDTKDSGFFVTAWIALYDSSSRTLHYSCCGHPPGIIRRKNGELEELSTAGMALGVMEEAKFSFAKTTFAPGDLLLLYTDGFTEAHDKLGNQWGKAHFFDAVQKSPASSAQGLLDSLFKEVAHFTDGALQHDDLTLLAIKIL